MDRRTFLKTTTAAAAASTATTGVAQANDLAAPITIKSRHEFQIAVPDKPHLADAALEVMGDIEIASRGRIVMHCSETTETPGKHAISTGQIDGAFGYLPDICTAPELSVFTGLPGDIALSPDNLMVWLEAAGGAMFLNEFATDLGVAAFVSGHSGAQTGIWADQKMDGLRVFSSANIATTGLGHSIVDTIRDAYKIPAPSQPVHNLIETAAPPLQAYLELPAANRAVWYRDGFHNQGFATTLILSQDTWQKLEASDQLLIETMTRAAAHKSLAHVKASNRLMAPSILPSLPTVRRPLPADIASAISHTAVEVTYAAASQNRQISQAFQAYSTFYETMMGMPLPKPANLQSVAVS